MVNQAVCPLVVLQQNAAGLLLSQVAQDMHLYRLA